MNTENVVWFLIVFVTAAVWHRIGIIQGRRKL